MTLCSNPDCGSALNDGRIYCSDFCQREAKRIHGPVLHMSTIDAVIRQGIKNIAENGSGISDDVIVLEAVREIHRALAHKAGVIPFWKNKEVLS